MTKTPQTGIDSNDHAKAVADLLYLIECNETFVVTSHARPDGDAIGSALGMMHLLESMGKRVAVCFADPIPTFFSCLPGVERIVPSLPAEMPDVAFLLECDSIARTGFALIPARTTVNVDHHLSGRAFADHNWINSRACAVGAMVYELVMASGKPLTAAIASCLYAALLTDTGSFTYPSTNAHTFGVARHLLEAGASASEIAQAVYYSLPPSKIRLLGAALSNMSMEAEVAWSAVSQEEIDRAHATTEDCEGVVDYLIGMSGVRAAVFLRETPARNQYRLSLRSKGTIDVAAIAEKLGGGGHRNASGCSLPGPLHTATVTAVAALQEAVRGQTQELAAPTLVG